CLEARDPVVDRDARGLPLNRQLVRIEIVARRLGGPRVRRQLRRLERVSRQIAAAREPRPSVLPDDGLNRRLAPEDGAAVLQWPAAEMREAPATVAMLNERSVSCRLQAKLGIARARNERIPRHDLVRTLDGSRPRDRLRMSGERAALRGQQVIPAVDLVYVRSLDEAETRAEKNVLDRTDQRLLRGIVFLQQDAAEAVVLRAMVPQHVEEPFAAVVVVKKRGIEARGVEVDGLGPGTFDARCRNEEVAYGVDAADPATHVGVDQVEQPIRITQRARPDAAGVRPAAQIELRVASERARHDAPMLEISRMRDLHARKPFERRGGDVVVVLDANNRRIGIESGQHGVLDRSHELAWIDDGASRILAECREAGKTFRSSK